MRRIPAPPKLTPVRAGVAVSGARLVSALRADSLDRALAAGRDPTCSYALTLRAARLTSMRRRSQLAAGIDRLATSGAVPRRSVVAGPAAAVSANRDRLVGLAALLRCGGPLYAAGVARLRLLLTDPASPAHVGDAAALAGALDAAGRALAGHPTSPRVLPTRAGDPGRERQASGSHLLLDGRWVHGRREAS